MRPLRVLAVLLAVFAAGCSGASPALPKANGQSIDTWHDAVHRVTCWVSYGYQKGGISCLPDAQVYEP